MMMHETLVGGTARHADLPGWFAAGKTGTSQDFRDAWFVGFTSQMVTGVWLGNDDNSPSHKAVGGGLPVEIWSKFMRVAHQGVPPSTLPGLAGGGWLPMPGDNGAAPALPSAPRPSQPDNGGGLDSWLLDKLFGRR
jgi:penicillin-binding protein 1A